MVWFGLKVLQTLLTRICYNTQSATLCKLRFCPILSCTLWISLRSEEMSNERRSQNYRQNNSTDKCFYTSVINALEVSHYDIVLNVSHHQCKAQQRDTIAYRLLP
uniref:AlNc14C26G2546 protein n=1 Tax=Albugo laibachii Nc14 TaxID=890382 RepID=F0W6R0_9STRA|nr:AlNc14C26G2546 [Albugo laibachii Nc14]|eukprot:CCA16805.1 AlNc14C26G2546 [Albugo laibachii Nc14]